MPGLTLDTSPRATNSSQPSQLQSQSQPYSQSPSNPRTNSISNSRSASPVRPPYSPLTPTLRTARLATTDSNQQQNNVSTPTIAQPPRQTYTHSQPPQTSIPQPPPVPIDFTDNPDAIALKSAISILQIQARTAASDIKTLQKVKERALEDPEGFSEALGRGEIKVKPDPWRNPGPIEDDDDDEDEKMDVEMNGGEGKVKKWPLLPTPQDVVRCPPINWTQYAIVGDSLDKLHKDQQARPTEGMPQRVGPDGQLVFGGEGQRRAGDVGVVAPFAPGKDKIEKKKGGKK